MKLDKRLLSEARPERLKVAWVVALGVLGGAALVTQAYLLSRAVGQVFLGGRTLDQVQGLLLGFLALSVGRAGLAWAADVAAAGVAVQVKANLRDRLARHLLHLGPAYTRGEHSGELAQTVAQGVEALDAYFRHYLPQLALSALVPLTVLIVVFPLDWLSGLVLLLTAPLLPLFMALIGQAAGERSRRQWETLSRMSAHFLDMLQGLATLKILGRSRDQIRTIAEISERYGQVTMGVLRVAFLSALVLEMVSTLSTAVLAVQVGLRLLAGRLAFEQAFFVLILAPEFYLPLRTLGARFHAGMEGVAAAQRIYQVLAARGQQPPAPNRDSAAFAEQAAVGGIRLRIDDLHYAYDGGDRPALNGLSLAVAPGEKVAVVGPSGAGKTTLAHLLLRFLEPQQGRIAVDGRPLWEIAPADWRRLVAWVPQSPYLFFGSAADNIRLARPDASLEEVKWAAEQAHAAAFLEALPQGYDTPVGERGARLSSGEAQRIALARAFLKDAPLIILDEATAHLDPEVESQVQEAMERLLAGRTALIIAHRLATVTRADRIAVLDGGVVVQEGSHAALVREEGLYRRLVSASGAGGGAGQAASWAEAADPAVGAGLKPAPTAAGLGQDGPRPETPAGARLWAGQAPLGLRLLGLAAPFAPQMVLAVLLGAATIASSIGLMTTSAALIARAALRPSIADLQMAIVGVRAFGIARGLLRYLERYLSHQTTFRLLARLRATFFAALEPLAPARLWQYRSGDLLARIVADVQTLEELFLRVIAPPAVALLVSVLACLIVGHYSPNLAYTLLGFLLLAGLGLPALARAQGRGSGRKMIRLRARLYGTLIDGIQGIADLLAAGAEGRHLDRIRELNRSLGAVEGRQAVAGGLQSALAGLLMNVATLAMLLVAIPLVSVGRLDGVYLALLTMAVLSSFEAVLPLPRAFADLEHSLEAGRRLFEIVGAAPAVVDPPYPQRVPDRFGLQVEDLTFAYGEKGGRVLDEIGFELPPGSTVALVGPSGAGKSTLVHLLLRFWDYRRGRILAGAHDLRSYGQEDWRRQAGVVSQGTYLFTATVRENLAMARPGALEEELVAAAQQAQIHDFVRSLPHGYDTWIGEQGLRLSEGQRQRLAIARALLRGAPFLILDEPTANMDTLTEREVMGSLRALGAGRTTLFVTHRLAGLEHVDQIVVLREGRIVERGRHAELLEREGLYHRIWTAQTQRLG